MTDTITAFKIAWLNDHDAFEPADPKSPTFVDAITDAAEEVRS